MVLGAGWVYDRFNKCEIYILISAYLTTKNFIQFPLLYNSLTYIFSGLGRKLPNNFLVFILVFSKNFDNIFAFDVDR